MSFSGHSYGGKGSSQKKDRKKKQEFHKHKLKFTEEEHLNFEQLKGRVTLSLQKLGQQVFSAEGYTFQNWMTSFNLLLDDFEEKAENLPDDYYSERERLTAELLKPLDTSDIDLETGKIEKEVESVNTEISKITAMASARRERERKAASRISDLKRERLDSDSELDDAMKDLGEAKKKQSFFGKLFSGSKSSAVDSAKDKVSSLKAKRKTIEESIQELESDSSISVEKLDARLSYYKEKLAALQLELAGWNSKKQERMQLAEKRAETTDALSKMISSIKLEVAPDQN